MNRLRRLLFPAAGRHRTPWLVVVCSAVVLTVSMQSASAAGRVFPIQDFESVREKWIGLETTVEGRKTVYDPLLIKLRNSTIYFRPQGELPRLRERNSNIQLTGTLEKVNGKLEFRVRSIRESPGDLEQFVLRERNLKRTVPSEWYELADWVESRGKFYQDSDLLEKARECRVRGFDIERTQLKETDHQGRMSLAMRAPELGIPETTKQELIHEAYLLRRKAVLETPEAAAEQQLLTDMERDLPGCKTPVVPDNPGLRQRYLMNPESFYAAAKPAERPVLHRILWSSLQIGRLEQQLASDYRNGFEIAAAIDEELPEFHARAETYREKTLQVRASNVENMSRSEVLKLRQDYRERDQPKLGDEAVAAWLEWRKKKLATDDLEGLLNLADQYEELLLQPETRLRLVLAAAERFPTSPEIASRLTKLGYRLHDNKWITEEKFLSIPQGRLEVAMQQGRVELGMTTEQVQKSLGFPASTTRISARGVVNEIWTYQSPGSKQPTMIYFSRRLPTVVSHVVGIDQLP